jgi:hypothetical protein
MSTQPQRRTVVNPALLKNATNILDSSSSEDDCQVLNSDASALPAKAGMTMALGDDVFPSNSTEPLASGLTPEGGGRSRTKKKLPVWDLEF